MASILILKTGSTLPDVEQHHGDFDTWFQAGLGDLLPTTVVDATVAHAAEAEYPEPNELAGVVITGSPAMVSHRETWSERTADWLRESVPHLPMLGVCYGHQLLAHALGGEVGPNPSGRHIGTVNITMTEMGIDDPLLSAFPADSVVNVTHVERVLRPPAGASVLATASVDPFHALRFGPMAWGMQFHPEFNGAIMRAYIQARQDHINSEGLDARAIEQTVTDTPQSFELLGSFARLCFSYQADKAEKSGWRWA